MTQEVDPRTGLPASQVNVNAPAAPVTTGYRGPLWTARRIIMLFFGVIEALIALRVLLLMLGANAGNGIVDAIYGISEPLVAPFRGIFAIDRVTPTGNSVIDVGALVAIVGWFLIALLVEAILRIANREPTT